MKKWVFLFFIFSVITSVLPAQNFSQTFDEIPIASELALGLYISESNEIYCTSGLVCQNLTVGCTNVYKFQSNGDLVWSRLFSNNRPANWENVFVENDTVFLAGQDNIINDERILDEILIDSETGDSLGILYSNMPDNISLSNFGQLIVNDLIYVYGGASNLNVQFDGPGYIHVMDKQGNYLHHLEYRQDNFNSIFQLMEGPDGNLYFLCASGSQLGFDDFWLVSWATDTDETEVVVHLPFQSSWVAPFYTMLSDQLIITKNIVDFPGPFRPLFALEGYTYSGDSLWHYELVPESFSDDRQYAINEMTSCENDDFLICGQFDNGDKNDAGFIMRFNNEGELLWERHYRAYDDFGLQRDSYLSALREMPDGSIVAIGGMQQVSEFGAEEDFWILKVDENGCYREGVDCEDVTLSQWVTSVDEEVEDHNFVVFPNPTSGELTIELPEILSGRLSVKSLTGQVIFTQEIDYSEHIKLDLYGQESGMYVVEVVSEGGVRYMERVVLY